MDRYIHYEHFFKNTLIALRHHDWSITWDIGSGSYCYVKQKRIDIGVDYGGDLRQIILHEIAHIDTAKYCNKRHNQQL